MDGLLRHRDQNEVPRLSRWAEQHGERYTPCEALVTMAESGTRYY